MREVAPPTTPRQVSLQQSLSLKWGGGRRVGCKQGRSKIQRSHPGGQMAATWLAGPNWCGSNLRSQPVLERTGWAEAAALGGTGKQHRLCLRLQGKMAASPSAMSVKNTVGDAQTGVWAGLNAEDCAIEKRSTGIYQCTSLFFYSSASEEIYEI